MTRSHTLLLAAMLLGAACSSDDAGSTTDPLTVKVQDNSFSPSAKTIIVGQTVTWKWTGSAAHSVTFSGTDTSPTQSSGTFTKTFSTPGTYPYTCLVHGTAMSGTITVNSPASGITY